MSANPSHEAEVAAPLIAALRDVPTEITRYFLASAIALAVDAGLYIGLIRLADVHYLAAAPAGYAAGIGIVYLLSTRWVFKSRRLSHPGSEFVIFALVGIASLLVNQLVIYACVEHLSTSYEIAKITSAAIVFGINFGGRKILLFTEY